MECFVIMPYNMSDVYENAIKYSCAKSGFNCTRVDEINTPGNIVNDIKRMIQKADVIIADITGNNPNVLYEIGVAHYYKKHVIMICQDIKKVPFDLKTYRFIEYNSSYSGIINLRDRLKNILNEIKSRVLVM